MLLMCYYSSFPVQQIATGKSKLVFWDWNILCKHIHMRSSNGVVNSTSQVHPSRLVQKASILGVRHLSSLMRIHLFESGAAYLLPFLVLSCSWSRCTLQCTSKSNYSERYHIICSGGSRGRGGGDCPLRPSPLDPPPPFGAPNATNHSGVCLPEYQI